MITAIVGLGLIGGSVGLNLKRYENFKKVIGVDNNKKHAKQAKVLDLVDEILDLKNALAIADLIILAIPVDKICTLLPKIFDLMKKNAVVTDLGSTKYSIYKVIKDHPKRGRYLGAHPMAGTENSGPTAAFAGLFRGKNTVLCDCDLSDKDVLLQVTNLFKLLKMNLIYMNSKDHDRHIAYVSHLSHISSFTLGLTVLDIEKNEKNIFDMAGTGFASTVRLAKSSSKMWSPIFEQNSKNLTTALDQYIKHLQEFKQVIQQKDLTKANELMTRANDIRRVLDGIELKEK